MNALTYVLLGIAVIVAAVAIVANAKPRSERWNTNARLVMWTCGGFAIVAAVVSIGR